jgi:hypothetical protein
MSRKTLNVKGFVSGINEALKQSTTMSQEFRWGLMSACEAALQSSGNYKGFRYLTIDEVPEGKLPGIWYENGKPSFENTDYTRVEYTI